ncbi:hypothetical protein [Thiohalorhabdus methylotrophus]|uniref:Uncharacterized protein n=1 Tax=Thiohalorhabdus methylotrophus TaxID=3242694 RepID=A0ABV4TUB9_9GAMM
MQMHASQLEWHTVLSSAIDNLSAQERILESLEVDAECGESWGQEDVIHRAHWRSHRRQCRLALSILEKLSKDPEAPDNGKRRKIVTVLDAEFDRLGEEWPR